MRASSPSQLVSLASLLILVVTIFVGCAKKKEVASDFVVFDGTTACAILVPEQASEAELRAARLIQGTLAKAARRPRDDFAIVRVAPPKGPMIRLRGLAETAGPRLEEWVACRVEPNRVEITAYPAEAIEAAAAWFLTSHTGARWFMPGALGEHVPRREELRLPFGETSHRPSFISRHIGLRGTHGQSEWGGRNRLRRWFSYTHAMNDLFKPEDLQANPAFVPLVNGQRRIPAAGEQNWQPNIASVAAAEHAAAVLKRRPEFSSAIGMNDSIRYDQSEETQRLLGEPRWFRLMPNFSPLVFRFVNEVAKRVPDRYLGAYAYDWTEDTPPFPIEKNVVPYLTADRSQWFDPRFAEEDKALIKRWTASGAEVVGIYDYYCGSPFLIPRPTLYAVAQSIPFAHAAGVRAFYAETYANWALDGPKAWLAAQLLWDASVKPEALLDTYYAEFWREAAGPMREFYALCDEQWLNQPLPSYWLKHYKNEHQYLLFPPEVRAELRGLLDQALSGATTELTRNRVRFVSAGFAVTEAFGAWNESRDRLSRAALRPQIDPAELLRLEAVYSDELNALQERFTALKARHPLAISSDLLEDYTRNDPRRRSEWRRGEAAYSASGATRLNAQELLMDPELAQLEIGSTTGFFDLEWVKRGAWRGHGEPYETRRVSLVKPGTGRSALRGDGEANLKPEDQKTNSGLLPPPPGGHPSQSASGHRSAIEMPSRREGTATGPGLAAASNRTSSPPGSVRSQVAGLLFLGCKQETMSQLVRGAPDKRYVARVKVRGKVSPGNMTFLILNFQDAQGRTLGMGTLDRLPVGEWGRMTEDGGRRTEDGEQRTEDVRLRHGGLRRDSSGRAAAGEVDGERRTDDGGQTTDAGGQTTEEVQHNRGLGGQHDAAGEGRSEAVELITWADAPPETAWVGLGVRALNQVDEDHAVFTEFSLREVNKEQ